MLTYAAGGADGNDVVTAELQLTDNYNNAVKNEDIVALTWALARVLHLQLAHVQVSVGNALEPLSLSLSLSLSLCNELPQVSSKLKPRRVYYC